MDGADTDKESFAQWAPSNSLTRFAPSPTGYLHLGHVLSMAYVFGLADSVGAKVLLRIEDHDRQRCRKEYETAIFDDMAWLGFYPDNWESLTQKPTSIYRQSDNIERYEQVLKELRERDLVYACCCSRKQIIEASEEDLSELFYPGTCRNKKHSFNGDVGRRCIFDDAEQTWDDFYHGRVVHKPSEQCGDLLLQDRHENYTYNFAVVVDDSDQGVNVVVRGDDLVHTTGRQMQLAALLGRENAPKFAHHKLLHEDNGQKLSKRARSYGIIERRLAGECPKSVLGDALYQAGLIDTLRPITPDQLPEVLLRT